MKQSIPITLLTGYLGSGKTTLLNHILNNQKGYKIAVIVNDIGEVNIDADLIAKDGIVNSKDESLVPLENGCICCTLKTDLIEQITEIINTKKFDYIVIEASGICEPVPIAQTICAMEDAYDEYKMPKLCYLDSIISVVDAKRLSDEYSSGGDLLNDKIEDQDIESLIIQQIEFCDTIILNKVDEVSKEDLNSVKDVIKALQPNAEIIETNYSKVDMDKILETHKFDFERIATSSGWYAELEKDEEEHEEHCCKHHHDEKHGCHCNDECSCGCHDGKECTCGEECSCGCNCKDGCKCDDNCTCGCHNESSCNCGCDCECECPDDCDCGCKEGKECTCKHEHQEHHCSCGHHHDHDHKHGDEYGINTFTYYRREPMDRKKFYEYIGKPWPKKIIRVKGITYFEDDKDMSYMFEQAGSLKDIVEAGLWLAAESPKFQKEVLKANPDLEKDWDPFYGDRMVKLVFIGKGISKEEITKELDNI